MMRGIRGATTVERDDRELIHEAAREMVRAILERNRLCAEEIGAAIFSSTEDLTAAFPTEGVRALDGFSLVPLFDARQVAVGGSLPRCIRVIILAETDAAQAEIRHVYLRGATELRADLTADGAPSPNVSDAGGGDDAEKIFPEM